MKTHQIQTYQHSIRAQQEMRAILKFVQTLRTPEYIPKLSLVVAQKKRSKCNTTAKKVNIDKKICFLLYELLILAAFQSAKRYLLGIYIALIKLKKCSKNALLTISYVSTRNITN